MPAYDSQITTTTIESTKMQNLSLSNNKPNIIKINVGGQIFQTTKETLTLAGPDSLFSKLTASSSTHQFLDRDPELFSILLSLLRTGTLPSKAKAFGVQDLIQESRFYNVESLLLNSLADPNQFDAFALQRSSLLPLNGRDYASTIASTPFGTLLVSHGSKITTFDWSMSKKSTILTQFSAVDSLLGISPSIAAAGATDFSGLQILDLNEGSVKEVLSWENMTRSSSTVQAIGKSNDLLFTSFESGRRNSNSIMVHDLKTFRPVSEIARCEIYGADLGSAIPATKLKWVSGFNLLMASGSHSGLSGVFGNIKLWDIRSGSVAWEMKEKVDCFADVAVSDSLSSIFKVGVNSGEVFYMDLRMLTGSENSSWVSCSGERRVINEKKEGHGCKIESHGNHVFCSKGADIELWSEVVMGSKISAREDVLLRERVFRKNLLGKAKDIGGSRITNLAFGGSKMFVTRKDQHAVEVWRSTPK
ncbi:hypothetical protein ACFE04_015739 [Oxalis oulophora]